jgi:FtsZ-interacting cell division protein ZipA
MSELQISLMGIGAVVIVAVYAYSAWRQRQYRRKFGAAFRHQHEDALYQPPAARPPGGLAEADGDPFAGEMEQALAGETARPDAGDELCSALDAATDYIVVLSSSSPMHVAALAPLWQQRFDFGKNVNVCGLNTASGAMERVVAESMQSYSEFHLALQLADRNGAVSEGRLKSFHDLARGMAQQTDADAAMPDVAEAAARAQQLDAFCAEVDQMIGLNILPGGDRLLPGSEISLVAAMHGFTLQADGSFHLLDERGHTLFTLANFDSEPFQHHTIKQMRVNGLSLMLDVPRVEHPMQRFDEMAVLARKIGMELHAAVVDDHRVALSETAVAMIRGQVATIENRMLEYPIVPGSAQARRLFS